MSGKSFTVTVDTTKLRKEFRKIRIERAQLDGEYDALNAARGKPLQRNLRYRNDIELFRHYRVHYDHYLTFYKNLRAAPKLKGLALILLGYLIAWGWLSLLGGIL